MFFYVCGGAEGSWYAQWDAVGGRAPVGDCRGYVWLGSWEGLVSVALVFACASDVSEGLSWVDAVCVLLSRSEPIESTQGCFERENGEVGGFRR